MIEVFKIVNNYYDPGASVKFNFYPFGITRGNKFKLQKFTCHYNIRQDAQLSQKDRSAGCVIVFAKSRRLQLGDNILWTL